MFSGNFANSSFDEGRNYGVVDNDWQDVDDLGALFEADWSQKKPDLACTRLPVSPVNARARLLALIDGARTTLDIEALYLNDSALLKAVAAAQRRGVVVRLLINDPSFGLGDGSAERGLKTAGVAVRRSGALFIHAKVLIIDGGALFVGSQNFSRSALDSNREVGVVVGKKELDLARVQRTFDQDWGASKAL
ncbi:MAG: hypothetical protein EXR72_04755 [Myxococcales bacterium]|nr:hypothetical protein [Myxococcales bacterium]